MKQSFLMNILRSVFYSLILFFIGMLYWSSSLVESNLQTLKVEMSKLKKSLNSIQDDIRALSSDGVKVNRNDSNISSFMKREHIDDNLPNLLQIDSYYETALPKLLGNDFKPFGFLVDGTMGKYDNMLPFNDWVEVNKWSNWCNVSVGINQFGKYEKYAPDMAIKMEERLTEDGKPEYWIHLRNDVFWEPLKVSFFDNSITLDESFFKRHQVTADDFKFYYDAIMNPFLAETASLRPYFQDVEEFRVIDPLTFVVRFKTKEFIEDGKQTFKVKYASKLLTLGLKPMASFVYKYYSNGKKIVDDEDPLTYQKSPVFAQAFNQHFARNIIVSCGPLIFDGKTDRQINFKRNNRFYNQLSCLVEGREILIKENAENLWQDFKGNKLSTYSIQPDQLLEYENFLKTSHYLNQKAENKGIEKLDYFARAFSYIGWNEKNILFNSAKVRRALTLGIDRERLINQYLNGKAIQITGPSYPFDNSYDKNIKPWPFDPILAKRYLEEEGWTDHNGDGILDKEINGELVNFSFTLNYGTRSTLVRSIAEFIANSLKEIGIDCKLVGIDAPELSAKIHDKSFDAIMLAWSLGSPPVDHRQLWYTNEDDKGSSNYISFSNKEVDQIIDALDYESDLEKRIALYHRFQQILHEEAPYVFLWCPEVSFLYREYVKGVFLPIDRQDLIPGATVAEPESSSFWITR